MACVNVEVFIVFSIGHCTIYYSVSMGRKGYDFIGCVNGRFASFAGRFCRLCGNGNRDDILSWGAGCEGVKAQPA